MLKAVNHPLRQRILKTLHQEAGISVTELYQKLRLEQSVASQHLGILRRADFVIPERQARHVCYFVNYERLQLLHEQTKALLN